METRRQMRNVLTNLLDAVKQKLDIKKANVMSENELLNIFEFVDMKKDGVLDFEEVYYFLLKFRSKTLQLLKKYYLQKKKLIY